MDIRPRVFESGYQLEMHKLAAQHRWVPRIADLVRRPNVVAGPVLEDGGMIGDRWGVSDSEALRSYPCDDFVTSPTLRAWRGVCVKAPAEAVWPWVAQVRLAPYSYDWIDNLGRRSPRALAGLPEPQAGERFTTAGGRAMGRILSVDPGRQLTGTIMGAVMSYVLVPQGHDTARLLLKIVMRAPRWAALGLSVGDLIMARRQLLNLKQLAERHQSHRTALQAAGQGDEKETDRPRPVSSASAASPRLHCLATRSSEAAFSGCWIQSAGSALFWPQVVRGSWPGH